MPEKNLPVPVPETVQDDKEFTHVVFNTTTMDAVSKHKSADDAEKEADLMRRYHGNDIFQVRSLDEAKQHFEDTGDVHKITATGDGTQHARIQPDARVNEVAKDKSQVLEDNAMYHVGHDGNPNETNETDKKAKNKHEDK